LRDDAAAASGFLSARGESARFFASNDDARLVLSSTAEGLVVALPPERSLEEFHFDDARHGHTLKLLPDPSLLEPFRADYPQRSPAWIRPSAAAFVSSDLTPQESQELARVTGPVLQDRAERYGGRRPMSAAAPDVIASRHIFHAGNEAATKFVAEEFQAVGQGKLTVRLHKFTHAGRQLYNVEAELTGASPELVLVTAHLDSTAASSTPYDAARDPAPGVDDDASGMAAVMSIAERFVALAGSALPNRTIRFVLFNAEEHGLVGSKAYARQQKLMNAPIVAVFQMDMVGYNRLLPRAWEIHAGYSASQDVEQRSLLLAKLLQRVSAVVAPQLDAPQVYSSATPGGRPGRGAERPRVLPRLRLRGVRGIRGLLRRTRAGIAGCRGQPELPQEGRHLHRRRLRSRHRPRACRRGMGDGEGVGGRFRQPVHRQRSIIHAPRTRYAPYQRTPVQNHSRRRPGANAALIEPFTFSRADRAR
jgi:leucyl aminopeptidase